MSLVARTLEEHGIVTVIIGSALDIVQYCGVPRYLHNDFPLGNPCGIPYDKPMQEAIIHQALTLAQSAAEPGKTVRSPFTWHGSDDWRDRYSRVDDSNREHLHNLGKLRRQQQATVKAKGEQRAPMIAEK